MKKQWSILVLIVLGIIAAAAAAFLVATYQARQVGKRPHRPENEIVVAAKDLPELTVVDASSVERRTVPAGGTVAKDQMFDPSQVIGKVLRHRMKKGQAFTRDCFALEGSGATLASALPEGMRLVAVSLLDYEGLEHLLYPGSKVDVLASFRVPGSMGTDQVSATLLQGVQVWAIEDQTVFSPEEAKGRPAVGRGIEKRRVVTLMVNPNQAQALQLAMEHGSVSLAMCNPLAEEMPAPNPTSLHQLAREGFVTLAPKPGEEATKPAHVLPRWQVVVIRGGETKTQTFQVPADMSGGQESD